MVKREFLLAFLVVSLLAPALLVTADDVSCGNGRCDAGENACTCAADCGICGGDVPEAIKKCAYYGCNDDSTICQVNTKTNCCGNLICEGEEDYASCAVDCLPKSLSLELIEPDFSKSFFRAEETLFKVKITGDGKKLLAANVDLTAPFGKFKVLNNGKYPDEDSSDGIYTIIFVVDDSVDAGNNPLHLEVEFPKTGDNRVTQDANYVLKVDPNLDVAFNTTESYTLGDVIDLGGTISKNGSKFSLPLNLRLFDGRSTIYDKNIVSGENGAFVANYHSSLIDRNGMWKVSIEGIDANRNTASGEKEFTVIIPGTEEFFTVELLTAIEDSYERGADISIIAVVKDSGEEDVEGAEVKLFSPLNETIELVQLKPGQYSGTYHIPFGMPVGAQRMVISASKGAEGSSVSGSTDIEFEVNKTEIIVEVVEPSERHYQAGNDLAPAVFLSYANGEWVVDATVTVLINNKEVELTPSKTGFFEAEYILQEKDMGRFRISFKAEDAFENMGSAEADIEVSGFSLAHIVQENLGTILITIAVLAIVSFAARSFYMRMTEKARLEKRKKQLTALETELQKKHFEQGIVKNDEFAELTEKYESELYNINERLKELKKSATKKK